MQLNSVKACRLRPLGGLNKRLNDFKNLLASDFSGHLEQPTTAPIAVNLLALWANSRGSNRACHPGVTLVHRAAMKELCNDKTAVAVHPLYQGGPAVCLFFVRKPRLKGIALTVLFININSLGQNSAPTSPGEVFVIASHLISDQSLLGCTCPC